MITTELISNETARQALNERQFRDDVLEGLSSSPKFLSSKYLYDDRGSELFQEITRHPDYYPTRTEVGILRMVQKQLPRIVSGKELDIIELGVGDGHKSQLILDGFFAAGVRVNYYPIDISRKALGMVKEMIPEHSLLHRHGVVGEYMDGLSFLSKRSSNPQLLLFLGSNIGNFTPHQSRLFLEQVRAQLNTSGYLFVGFDLVKDHQVLNRAYNDSDGVTKAFNLNVLHRINQELGGEFDVSQFDHYGAFNPGLGAMESFLVSKVKQDVRIGALDRVISFEAFEPIHTEYSFKYTTDGIEKLAEGSGFSIVESFTDSRGYFVDSLWQVKASTD